MRNNMEDSQMDKPLVRDPVQVGVGMSIDDMEEEIEKQERCQCSVGQ